MRSLFAVLIALVMAFAPFAMQGASAAMPTDHHAASVSEAHCGGEEGDVDEGVDHPCCAAMCAGAALAAVLSADLPNPTAGSDEPAVEQFGRSHVAKLPTPPPRGA